MCSQEKSLCHPVCSLYSHANQKKKDVGFLILSHGVRSSTLDENILVRDMYGLVFQLQFLAAIFSATAWAITMVLSAEHIRNESLLYVDESVYTDINQRSYYQKYSNHYNRCVQLPLLWFLHLSSDVYVYILTQNPEWKACMHCSRLIYKAICSEYWKHAAVVCDIAFKL